MRSLRMRVVEMGAALVTTACSLVGQTMLPEQTVQHLPSDVCVTPDGLIGIVRSSEAGPPSSQPDGVTAWDMFSGARLTIAGASSALGLGENQGFFMTTGPGGVPPAVHFSDLVQTTNTRAITIGSQRSAAGQPDDTTVVDVLRLDSSFDPPVVAHLSHHTIQGTGGATGVAGHAHDVAISPTGKIAVVNHRNWVHFFDLRFGGQIGAHNIGARPIQFPLPSGPIYDECTPDLAVDSVAITSTRAIVVTTKRDRSNPSNPTRLTVVYVFNTTANPVTLLSEIHVDSQAITDGVGAVAHDLAVTPDESTAVVTGEAVIGMIDLGSPTPGLKGIFLEPLDTRTYRINQDSVEVTNKYAVVTSTHLWTQPFVALRWRVQVFDLQSTPPFALVFQQDDPVTSTRNDPHDLTITPSGKYAALRSDMQVVLLQGLDSSPPFSWTSFSVAGTPSFAWPNTYPSDSIVSTNVAVAAIGTSIYTGTKHSANIAFIDLTVATPSLSQGEIVQDLKRIRAADLALTPSGDRVVLRSSDDDGQSVSAHDISIWSMIPPFAPTPVPVWTGGVSGNALCVDSLEMGVGSFIEIAETRPPFANAGSGFVRVVSLQ